MLPNENVHNLMEEGGPRAALEKHLDLKRENNNHIRIISCGGDGTTGWILSVMDSMNIPAGICPVGRYQFTLSITLLKSRFSEKYTILSDDFNFELLNFSKTSLHWHYSSWHWE